MGAAGPGLPPWLPQALLCALSLLCAHRARQVTGGPAAGFLLQALAAATDALHPLLVARHPRRDPLPGAWVSAMLAQPLVAFGYHRLSGDRATANLLLLGAAAATPVAASGFPEEGRELAARAVTFLAAGSILTLAALTGNAAGAAGSLLWLAGNLGLGAQHGGHPWVLAAGSVALERGLRAQRLGLS